MSLQPSTSGSRFVQGSGAPQGTTDTGLDEDLCFRDPSAHAYGLWVKLLFLGVQRPRGLPLILY
jgi:hypothetical protein